MIWTELTKKAYDIACKSHRGQSDRGGVPYVVHPCTLAAQMTTEEAAATALLHDVLEDSETSREDLAEQGIPDRIIWAVVLLSRNCWPGLLYMEYIQNLRQDPIAVMVKKADLQHNLNLSRLGHAPTEEELSLHHRYEKAIRLLDS